MPAPSWSRHRPSRSGSSQKLVDVSLMEASGTLASSRLASATAPENWVHAARTALTTTKVSRAAEELTNERDYQDESMAPRSSRLGCEWATAHDGAGFAPEWGELGKPLGLDRRRDIRRGHDRVRCPARWWSATTHAATRGRPAFAPTREPKCVVPKRETVEEVSVLRAL